MSKPNKLEAAQKQVSKLKGVSVPTEINENEVNCYHVLLISSKPNPATLEYEHKVRPQIFRRESFIKHKANFASAGYSNIVIFHDPTAKAAAEDKLPNSKKGIVAYLKEKEIEFSEDATYAELKAIAEANK